MDKSNSRRGLPEISINIHFLYEWRREPLWNFEYFSNPFYTIWLVINGCRRIETRTGSFDIHPMDLLIIPPNTLFRTRHCQAYKDEIHYLAMGVGIHCGDIPFEFVCRLPLQSSLSLDECQSLSQLWSRLLHQWQGSQSRDGFPSNRQTARTLSQADDELDNLLANLEFAAMERGMMASLIRYCEGASLEPFEAIDERVLKANLIMRHSVGNKLSMSNLCEQLFISEGHLRALFQANLKTSPMKHFLMLRLQRAKELLLTSGLTITEIAVQTGFDDLHHFGKMFRKYEQTSPSRYREMGRGE
ncbi:AraC family transcriptional regulator [Paenibacillus sp. HB172176]|uniref:AraC family transcriptional regulator n=1 Tax=Paenibacillus sp. HB172176 TaxID=2493690 RepID=UPI00143B441A|nr:AraC family transcriptional regulator [Paenibacillus sp. HB172176]